MEILVIEAYSESSDDFLVNVETLIILFIYKLSGCPNTELSINVLTKYNSDDPLVKINLKDIQYKLTTQLPEKTFYCKWPLILNNNHVISGISAVARQLVKSSRSEAVKDLLGFRGACLMSCAESSVWTRFCEIDMISVAKNALKNKFETNNLLIIPQEIARFEYHMSQPVKMHNIYKVARQLNQNTVIDTKTPVEQLNIDHEFSEGLYMTLADVILYPSFKIYFQKYSLEMVKNNLPLTFQWYEKIDKVLEGKIEFEVLSSKSNPSQAVVEEFLKQSLYIGDAPSHRTDKGAFTKQTDIDNALAEIAFLKEEIINRDFPFEFEDKFNWNDVPIVARPTGGALPQNRAERKCHQLENFVKAVGKLAENKRYKIVDFCSGSGHLGIVLAYHLPSCEIILVENKQRSLERAQDTIMKLKLTNICIVQSNLDYFDGNFDVGVSLHACGVATDLVIKACIKKRAHFVSCPCCYGGIKNCHQVIYPLSLQFKKRFFDPDLYFTLAHAADQTHGADDPKTQQGFLCMDVIDTDRRLFAESCGYKVHLCKLQPVTCSNKNNVLIGLCKDKM